MRKLKLDPDELAVQSFDTVHAADGHGGTVEARESTVPVTSVSCDPITACYSYPALSCMTQCAEGCTPDWTENPEECYLPTTLETCEPC